jgi:hypothetical protein
MVAFTSFFLQLLSLMATLIFKLLSVVPALIPDLFPPLMVCLEVTSAVMIPISAIDAVLPVTEGTDLFDAVFPDARRKLAIGNFNPGAVVMA